MAGKGIDLKSDPTVQKRVLFADFAVMKFNTIIQWLKRDNVVGEAVTSPPKFLERIAEENFDMAVVNLLLGGIGPFELISNVRATSKNPNIKIIVVSRQVHKLNIQNTIRAGANDFIADPFDNENLYHRVLYHLTPKLEVEPGGYENSVADSKNWQFIKLVLESTEGLSRMEKNQEHKTFLKILQDAANLLHSNRTSLIIVESETNTGLVLASSDDPNFYDFPITLSKYPEILHVMHTGNFVLIEDVNSNSMTQKINEKVRTIQIGSLMVFPVRFQGEVIGVLTIRRPTATEMPSMDVLRMLQAVANTMAAHSNVKALLRKIYKDFASQNTGT